MKWKYISHTSASNIERSINHSLGFTHFWRQMYEVVNLWEWDYITWNSRHCFFSTLQFDLMIYHYFGPFNFRALTMFDNL